MVLTVKHEKQKIEKKTHCTHYTQTIGNVNMSLYNIWYRKFLRSWLDCETGSEKLCVHARRL